MAQDRPRNKLGRYLEARGMTLADFAEATGLPISTLSRAQRGTVIPSPETMRVIAEHTGGEITPNDFILPAANEPTTPSEAA